MEEQRQRQEEEARRSTGQQQGGEPAAANVVAAATAAPSNDDAMLERALAMSMDQQPSGNVSSVASAAPTVLAPAYPDFATMTEEEQIAYAMQMSMQESSKSYSKIYYLVLPTKFLLTLIHPSFSELFVMIIFWTNCRFLHSNFHYINS